MNLLFTSVGRRSYLIKYFKEALGDKGKIFAANSNWISTAMEEADESVVTPLIYSEEYIPFLIKYCQENAIDAIIPLFDIDLPILSQNRKLFEVKGIKLIVADSSIIDICNDKWKTFVFLKDNGFNIIPTYLTIEEVVAALDEGIIHYPLIIKPRWGMGSMAIYQADNDEELQVLFRKSRREIFNSYLKYESSMNPNESVIIQQKMVGQEYGMDNICDLSGTYVTTVIRKKIGMRAGETDCAEIIENRSLLSEAQKLAELTRHPANMDIDVIVSEGVPYIFEMNARFGGGYPFGHVAGVNLPQAIIKWLNNEIVDKAILEPQIGVIAQKNIDIIPLHKDVTCGIKNCEALEIDLKKPDRFMVQSIAKFITYEIDPFLSIPLSQKLPICIEEYADKIVGKANCYVALKNEKIVGLVAAYIDNRIDDNRVFLTIFGVDHRERNQGIGTALLKKIADDTPSECILYTTVDEKNETAWRVYNRAGFCDCGVVNGRRHIEMKHHDFKS